MTFVQLEFMALCAITLSVYWLAPRRVQNLVLIVASFVFYGWIHPAWIGLLLYSATLDWSCGRGMLRWPDRKGWFLTLSITGNLALLGTFKYLDFFIENVGAASESLGLGFSPHTVGILLPVGISFYTFQTMSYTIDAYRGTMEPRRGFVDYLAFVSFFPQLVAGPIERASRLLPQLERDRRFDWAMLRSGLSLALVGVIKKVVIADTVAPYVDAMYAAPNPSWAMAWAGCLGFMVQLLADFTAYTDIARGVARMFGIELCVNFDHPFMARNPTDLWNRWHISLSSWFRDYVYFPVLDWRPIKRWPVLARVIVAVGVTMLLCGLWHGAAWHFVAWGLFWGAAQVVWIVAARKVPKRFHPKHVVLSLLLMVPVHLIAHQLFREPHLWRFVRHMTANPFRNGEHELVIAGYTAGLAASGAAILIGMMIIEEKVLERVRDTPAWPWLEAGFWSVAVVVISLFARSTQADFVYFAF